MLFLSASDWALLARSLSLTPHSPLASFGTYASFRALKRMLGPAAQPPPSFSHWLYGVRNGREVIVAIYTTGSGKSRHTWTAAVVRMDPPMLLGAAISKEPWLKLFAGGDVRLGIPMFDEELHLGALDPQGVQALLYPSDGNTQLLQTLVRFTREGLIVTDSTCVFRFSGVQTDPHELAVRLDQAAWVAAELERKRASMTRTPAEKATQAEWQAYADKARLRFDPARMQIDGQIGDTGIELALGANGDRMETSITVRWPQPLGGSVRVRRSSVFALLESLFIQDIQTGDPTFDSMFNVQGFPDYWVRHVFSNADLRSTLCTIAANASDIAFHDAGAHWVWPAPTFRAVELETHVGMAMRASDALFRTAQSAQPYR